MSQLQFRLFGKFTIRRDAHVLKGVDGSKEQELLSYLLIHRQRHNSREALADLLWGDITTERSKKYLRQTLWRLHTALEASSQNNQPLLLVEHDWVRLNPQSELWFDVAVFEQSFTNVKGISGRQLDPRDAQALKDSVKLYEGDLLEGWYQDWCLFERERLQNMYFSMLDKLMSYCEEHHEYEIGQGYGAMILRYDLARERTHRQLMNLQFLAGDRTAALRQYERCVAALRQELGVKPEQRTVSLYERIRADKLDEPDSSLSISSGPSAPDILSRLKQLQVIISAVQRRIQRDIEAVEARPRKGNKA